MLTNVVGKAFFFNRVFCFEFLHVNETVKCFTKHVAGSALILEVFILTL